jgi:hypothetical protein
MVNWYVLGILSRLLYGDMVYSVVICYVFLILVYFTMENLATLVWTVCPAIFCRCGSRASADRQRRRERGRLQDLRGRRVAVEQVGGRGRRRKWIRSQMTPSFLLSAAQSMSHFVTPTPKNLQYFLQSSFLIHHLVDRGYGSFSPWTPSTPCPRHHGLKWLKFLGLNDSFLLLQ